MRNQSLENGTPEARPPTPLCAGVGPCPAEGAHVASRAEPSLQRQVTPHLSGGPRSHCAELAEGRVASPNGPSTRAAMDDTDEKSRPHVLGHTSVPPQGGAPGAGSRQPQRLSASPRSLVQHEQPARKLGPGAPGSAQPSSAPHASRRSPHPLSPSARLLGWVPLEGSLCAWSLRCGLVRTTGLEVWVRSAGQLSLISQSEQVHKGVRPQASVPQMTKLGSEDAVPP